MIATMGQTQSRRWVLRTLWWMLLAIPYAVFLSYALAGPQRDFYYSYYAFHVIWDRLPIQQLYSMSAQHAWFMQRSFQVVPFAEFTYPPQFAVLLSWFAAFKLPFAMRLWSALSLGGYLLGTWMLAQLANPERNRIFRIVFYVAVFLNLPFWWDFTIGNTNSLVFFLVSSALYFRFVKANPWLAGVCLGVAAVFKLTPLFFAAYLVFNKEWKWLTAAFGAIAVATAATAGVVGIQPMVSYASHLSAITATTMKNGFAPYNSSLLGVLGLWQQHHVLDVSLPAIHRIFVLYEVLAVLGLGGYWVSRRQTVKSVSASRVLPHSRADLALGVLPIVLFSPLVEGPHMMTAWIAFVLLAGAWFARARETWSKHRLAGRVAKAWLMGIGAGLLFVWVVFTPFGWSMRTFLPSENFYILLLLTVCSIGMVPDFYAWRQKGLHRG
ncbi:DUF2029 domain-containing protein [Alicyclobacillus tolerans]|uniref:glycosyltransferase family 87 protein n=1 Tax=Alicyclobacillus tolerans TaxID=90970 RepID=UPI001F3E172B|nr:glycosyltransferase family 87 protein [Alicyclobacillus tolerans]MCF8567873.1 DUF2029 domain-containing protein [Alicyclobacillus tolerans]